MTRAALLLLLVVALTGCRTSELLTGDRATSESVVTVESEVVGEGKMADAEPAAAEPAAAEPAAAEPAAAAAIDSAAPTSIPAPATITTFFAAYPDDALAEPRYTARKPPRRAGEIRGVLDVRPLLGQPVLASPKPTAEVIATIAPEGLVTASDSCMWVLFQQEIPWTKGKLRCGDLFSREPDSGEGVEQMVPVLETITAKGTRWSRIIATNDGRTGWVRTESAPRRFTKVLAKYATGGSRTWDRMLYTEPGASPVKLDFRGAIELRIREARIVEGRTWLRVEARVDQCIEGSHRRLGEGWLPQHAEDGSLNVYYELSC